MFTGLLTFSTCTRLVLGVNSIMYMYADVLRRCFIWEHTWLWMLWVALYSCAPLRWWRVLWRPIPQKRAAPSMLRQQVPQNFERIYASSEQIAVGNKVYDVTKVHATREHFADTWRSSRARFAALMRTRTEWILAMETPAVDRYRFLLVDHKFAVTVNTDCESF